MGSNIIHRVINRGCATLTVIQIRLTSVPIQEGYRHRALLGCKKAKTPATDNQRKNAFKYKRSNKSQTEDNNQGRSIWVAKEIRNFQDETLTGSSHSKVNQRKHQRNTKHLEQRHKEKANDIDNQEPKFLTWEEKSDLRVHSLHDKTCTFCR